MKYLIFSIILLGCGVQERENKEESPTVSDEIKTVAPEIKEEKVTPPMAIAVSGEKPTCGPENENQLIYHVDDGLFYSCKGNDWAVIDLKGKDGEKGSDGVDGNDAIVKKTWTLKNTDETYFSNDGSLGAGFFIPKNSQIILHSNNYVQLTANGLNFSVNVFGKINQENKVILNHNLSSSLAVKITIGFDIDKNIDFFEWERSMDGNPPYFSKRNESIYVED